MPTETTTTTVTEGGATTTTTCTVTTADAAVAAAPAAGAPSGAAVACLGYTVGSDPRMDPRVVAPFAALGMDGAPAPTPVTMDSSREEILAWSAAVEAGFGGAFGAMYANYPAIEGVEKSTETITGAGGQEMTLFVSRPAGVADALPCVYHTHGGGMAIGHASDVNYHYTRDAMAAKGLVVVGVEFRNCAGADGLNVFPAGLDDCSAGLQWTFDNKAKLNITTITVSGESGGGNLALATTMKAVKDGKAEQVQGTYACCPYVAGGLLYSDGEASIAAGCNSLIENDGIFLNMAMMGPLAMVYTKDGDEKEPLAWPHYATLDDWKGMPPTVVSVNECDPLRDEGVLVGRKLVAAGVAASTRCVMGTCHAGDLLVTGPIFDATMRDIAGFCNSL